MALNIPMPGLPGDSLLKGLMTGSNLYANAMRPILERERQKQLEEHFQKELELRKAQMARAGANADLQRQLLQEQLTGLKHRNDPMYEFNQFKALQDMITGGGNPAVTQGIPTPPEQIPSFMPSAGPIAPDYDTSGQIDVPQINQGASTGFNSASQPQPASNPGGIDMELLKQHPMLRGFAKKMLGYDPLAAVPQTPEEKLKDKIKFEQEKTALKRKTLEDKEVVAVEKDIPAIKNSIEGVNELLKIARTNPDMFGHSFMPDRYAKISKNKNFGRWQNLIADRIAGLEGKLSSRGNVVALKMAASLKPSHAESQEVAIGKLESMKNELEKQLQRSEAVTGKKTSQYRDDDLVVVEGPNGQETMTYAQARKLGAE